MTLPNNRIVILLALVLVAAASALSACNFTGDSVVIVTATPRPTGLPTAEATSGAAAPLVVTLPPREDLDTVAFSPTDHVQGPGSAAVVMIHYADFQCRPCAAMARDLNLLRERYPETLRVIFRHFPDIVTHDKAGLALAAAEAAAAQDRFWDMHDLLFAEQSAWIDLTLDQFRGELVDYARTLELDVNAFEAYLSQDIAPLVEQFRLEALALDLAGIPSLIINGQPYSGRYDRYGLDEAYRFFALQARQYENQPSLTIDLDSYYRARLVTEKGNIEIELFTQAAPVTVNNFVFLAEDGWYNDITFHRVIPGLFAQTGDPSGTGMGGPGYTIVDERDNGLAFDREGLVAMAATSGTFNSAGSQFFITYGPLSEREFAGFTIFGQVVEGMDVVQALTSRDPLDPINYPDPPPGDRLLRVEILED